MRKIVNSTQSILTHTLSGYVFEPNEVLLIPAVDLDNMLDEQMRDHILSGDITVLDTLDNELTPTIGWSYFSSRSITIASSVAVDKNGTNQPLSGTNWVVVEAERILWDLNEDYDSSTDDFVVPIDGLFTMDCKILVSGLVNCSTIELALFKRGLADDYWFIIDRAYPGLLNLNEVVLSGAVPFDMYKDERFCLKVRLTKSAPLLGVSGTIVGDDDYTAWGYALNKLLPSE